MADISKIQIESGTYNIKDALLRNKAITNYNTVNDMINSTSLVLNSIVKTLGFYNKNDGGGAYYLIREINGDTTNDSTLIEIDNNLLAELIIEKEMNSKQFGLVGDGSTDETNKLQLFFSQNIEKYTLLNGNYLIDGNIDIESNSFILFMENAIITRKPTASGTYFMLNIGNKNNITIENAHLVGDKSEHLGVDGEWGYGIHVWASQNINLKNCIIENTWGDGIYVGYSYSVTNNQSPKHIYIDGCKVLNCSRNGYSICGGEDIVVSNCYSYNVKRTNPKCGIVIEPEAPVIVTPYLKNVIVDNFLSESNGIGIGITGNRYLMENIVINNHVSNNEVNGFVIGNLEGEGNIIYQNATINKCYESGIQINKKKYANVTIRNVIVDSTRKSNQTHNYNGAILIITSSSDDGNLIIDSVYNVKSYSQLYKFYDIITERGNGTFDGLIINNVISKDYLCLNNCTNVDLFNSKFITTSGYYLLNVDKNTIFNYIANGSPITANLTRNISDTLPDGDYEVILNENSGYRLDVVFNSNLNVYSTSGYGTTGRTYGCNYRGGYLKFHKKANAITILDNQGFSAS